MPEATSASESKSQLNNAQNNMDDEILVADARAGLTPAQEVERKLLNMLRTSPLLVSRLQSVRPRGR